jgi:hypothetical protein
MGIAKVALNFMVQNGKGELVKSLLCHPKLPHINPNEFILPLRRKGNERIFRYIRNGNQVGEIRYNITQGAMGKYPEYYLQDNGSFQKTLKPSIFISHLEGKKCGSKLMQIAGRDAQRLTEGRMVLDAQSVDGGLTTPDAFYYKLGLRKLNPKENELIKDYIERGETIPVDIFSDRMYLPKENLNHLLNYSKSKPKKTFSFPKVDRPISQIEVLPNTYIQNSKCRQIELWKRCNVPAPNDIKFPSCYITENTNGQKVIKPHLYIEGFEVKPEFEGKGAGREALTQIIEKSKAEGYEGRVMLSAMTLANQTGIKPPPSGFYYKCGFRPVDSKYEQILQDVMTGKVSKWDAPNGIDMYYHIPN